MRPLIALSTCLACLLGATALRADESGALLKVIQSKETSDVDRANAFEAIGDTAGAEAVAPLAGFLVDKKWSHYARFALQKMEGEIVADALISSLDTLEGDLKLGVIETIGRRRDAKAVSPLAKLLTQADPSIAAAAATALGGIGTTDAAAALRRALDSEQDSQRRESLASSLLLVGQRLFKMKNTPAAIKIFDQLREAELPKPYRIGATQSAILARGGAGVPLMVEQLKSADFAFFQAGLAVARVLPGEQATQAVSDLLQSESSPDRQALLILALNDRGDKRALPALVDQLQSNSAEIQTAAIDGIGTLGSAASVPLLLSISKAENSESVLNALVALQGSGVNAALVKAAAPPQTSAVAIRALGVRRVQEAAPLLLELSKAEPEAISQEAIVALGTTATQEQFHNLVALLKTAQSTGQQAAIQKAIQTAVFRSTQPDACSKALGAMVPTSSGKNREFLFEQIRTAGGAKAVALMQGFANGSDESLQDAATKTLGRWLSADAAPVLLEVAQGDGKFANRALGGYIRIFRQFELPETERVAMADQALQVARRSDDRIASIEAMVRFPCVGSFELALDQLQVPGSEAAAGKAALTIARTVLDLDPEAGKVGLQRLIDAEVSAELTTSAKALLQ